MVAKRDRDAVVVGGIAFAVLIAGAFAMKESDQTWQPGPNGVVVTNEQSYRAMVDQSEESGDDRSTSRGRPDPDVIESQHLAWMEIQKHVDDAIFMGQWKWESTPIDDCDWIVSGAVLGPRPSAPSERVPFIIRVRKVADHQWSVIQVSIKNKIVVDRLSAELRAQAALETRKAEATAKAAAEVAKIEQAKAAELELKERAARARLKHIRNQIEKGTFTDLEEKQLNKVIDEFLTLPLGNEAEELLERGRTL